MRVKQINFNDFQNKLFLCQNKLRKDPISFILIIEEWKNIIKKIFFNFQMKIHSECLMV